ncbi:MAG: hypothetical protein R3362_12660 [Rhodothermales bacterium]|nr:hypothetical protein [Rhodothermales bacterium]
MARDKTPIEPKLLLGMIALVVVLFVAWLTYQTVRQPTLDPDAAEAVTESPDQLIESPSNTGEGAVGPEATPPE